MNLKNIIRKSKIRIAAGAIGLSSILASGCELEEYLWMAESVGISDMSSYSQLAGRDDLSFEAARRFGPLDINLPRLAIDVPSYEDRFFSLRIGRDSDRRSGYHVDALIYGEDKQRGIGLHHFRPQDYARGAVNILGKGANIGQVWCVPPVCDYIYQQQQQANGNY